MTPQFLSALEKGIDLFNRQEFYDAHEVWEEAWIDELSDDRLLLQGLIQVAAGFYKLQVGAPGGTMKLLATGRDKLQRFLGRSHGVELEPLLAAVERWRQEAEAMVAERRAGYDPQQLPRIDFRKG